MKLSPLASQDVKTDVKTDIKNNCIFKNIAYLYGGGKIHNYILRIFTNNTLVYDIINLTGFSNVSNLISNALDLIFIQYIKYILINIFKIIWCSLKTCLILRLTAKD